MTKKVVTINAVAGNLSGIQRDGTILDNKYYNDGQWVRFQRGRPRKVGGYRQMTNLLHGYSRGIYVDTEDGYNNIFNGYSDGFERYVCNNLGVGAGVTPFNVNAGPLLTLNTLVGGSSYTNGTYTGVSLTGGTGTLAKATIVVSGSAVTSVTVTTKGNGYLVGDTLSALASSIGGTGSGFSIKVATVTSKFTSSVNNLYQIDEEYDSSGSGSRYIIVHPGQNLLHIDNTVNTAVLAGNPNGNTLFPLQDTGGTSPTNNFIEVSGGVVALHPYVFVYGNNGLIQNCSAGNPFDWNSPDTNSTNVSSQKIVKGLPLRGGSNAPAGLFWALDSLIRVSFSPTTVSTGTSTLQFYWRYDIVGSTTVLSSQSIIEYDGIYYWIGVDRFLIYSGVIKELPNNMNQNYFFDNLNYAQRQKVWATKVTRFGEIWWFYPKGDSVECNDAIIYNIREGTWYDAGTSIGATRTAGYYSQVFSYPVWAGEDLSAQQLLITQNITTVNGSTLVKTATNAQIYVGSIIVSVNLPLNTTILSITNDATAGIYDLVVSNAATVSSTVSASFYLPPNLCSLWQHEVGTDEIRGMQVNAIESFFETNNIGVVTSGPAQSLPVGDNYWTHIERIEPDFRQSGNMQLYVTGRPYAQEADYTTGPYTFGPNTGKIDLREQRREIRLKFVSNEAGGNYLLGMLLISASQGDVRGY